MSELFNGWKPKLGVLTLLIACGLMGGWLRSSTTQDTFIVGLGRGLQIRLISTNSRLIIAKVSIEGDEPISSHLWTSDAARDGEWSLRFLFSNGLSAPTISNAVTNEAYSVTTCGIGTDQTHVQVIACQFPYWPILMPLTLISAVLLLTTRQRSNRTQIVSPIAIKGT